VSDLPPYADMEHGVTGFKACTPEEFRVYLGRLVEDAALREHIGLAARAEVLRAHTSTVRAQEWGAFLVREAAGAGAGPARCARPLSC
jgi:hypothetical protein